MGIWFKHILFITRHDKGLGRAKAMFSPLHNKGMGIVGLTYTITQQVILQDCNLYVRLNARQHEKCFFIL